MILPTDAQQLREFAANTGLPKPLLRPYEKVIGLAVTETTAMVTVQCYRWTENTREVRFLKQGLYMLVWQRKSDSEPWEFQPAFAARVWNPEFKPTVIVKWGRVVTPDEARAQREWDLLCWRPGTDRSPLDGYSRVLEGPTAPKMEGYW